MKAVGESIPPSTSAPRMMDASPPSPPSGENVSGESFDWKEFGRALLSRRLEVRAANLRSTFFDVARDLDGGREWTDEHLRQLDYELQQTRRLVDLLWESDPVAQSYAELLEDREGDGE